MNDGFIGVSCRRDGATRNAEDAEGEEEENEHVQNRIMSVNISSCRCIALYSRKVEERERERESARFKSVNWRGVSVAIIFLNRQLNGG